MADNRISCAANDARRKEVLQICLDKFIAKGIWETSSRDLSSAIGLQSGGIYYYFKRIDDAIIACADEAVARLEANLIWPALQDVNDPGAMLAKLRTRADEMAPTMRFLVQVCANAKLRMRMEDTLSGVCERYAYFAERFAEALDCDRDAVAPYFYICVTAFADYMIFGKDLHINPQIQLVKRVLTDFVERKNQRNAE